MCIFDDLAWNRPAAHIKSQKLWLCSACGGGWEDITVEHYIVLLFINISERLGSGLQRVHSVCKPAIYTDRHHSYEAVLIIFLLEPLDTIHLGWEGIVDETFITSKLVSTCLPTSYIHRSSAQLSAIIDDQLESGLNKFKVIYIHSTLRTSGWLGKWSRTSVYWGRTDCKCACWGCIGDQQVTIQSWRPVVGRTKRFAGNCEQYAITIDESTSKATI